MDIPRRTRFFGGVLLNGSDLLTLCGDVHTWFMIFSSAFDIVLYTAHFSLAEQNLKQKRGEAVCGIFLLGVGAVFFLLFFWGLAGGGRDLCH